MQSNIFTAVVVFIVALAGLSARRSSAGLSLAFAAVGWLVLWYSRVRVLKP